MFSSLPSSIRSVASEGLLLFVGAYFAASLLKAHSMAIEDDEILDAYDEPPEERVLQPSFLKSDVSEMIRQQFDTPAYVYSKKILRERAENTLKFPAPFGHTVRLRYRNIIAIEYPYRDFFNAMVGSVCHEVMSKCKYSALFRQPRSSF